MNKNFTENKGTKKKTLSIYLRTFLIYLNGIIIGALFFGNKYALDTAHSYAITIVFGTITGILISTFLIEAE